jgi:hypothetical protein
VDRNIDPPYVVTDDYDPVARLADDYRRTRRKLAAVYVAAIVIGVVLLAVVRPELAAYVPNAEGVVEYQSTTASALTSGFGGFALGLGGSGLTTMALRRRDGRRYPY